ncbi:MAG: hypothetical protein DWI00_14370 [Planctomycetota bacterium]|nr:MAG: hypothetical protein DWI00_14370 [Planctomycetota bacterium]
MNGIQGLIDSRLAWQKYTLLLHAFFDPPKNLSLQRSRAGDSFTLSKQLRIEDDGNDGAGNVIEER